MHNAYAQRTHTHSLTHYSLADNDNDNSALRGSMHYYIATNTIFKPVRDYVKDDNNGSGLTNVGIVYCTLLHTRIKEFSGSGADCR